MLCDRMKVETEKKKPVSTFSNPRKPKLENEFPQRKKEESGKIIYKKENLQEREIIKKQIYKKTKFRRRDRWLRKYRKRS